MVAEGLLEELTGERHPGGESLRKRYCRATPLGHRELAAAAERLAGLPRPRARPLGKRWRMKTRPPVWFLAFITDPLVVTAILVHIESPHRPPPISPARGPPRISA